MTSPNAPQPQESYPRQEAATRRFRLGAPRGFVVSADGSRVAFLRSTGGRDPVGSLWVADIGSTGLAERCVVDARDLHDPGAELPAAERARRERMRETTTGITAFDTDRAVEHAVFVVDGDLYLADLVGSLAPRRLGQPGPAIDPRISPDGAHVAFVVDGSLWVIPTRPDGEPRPVALAEAPATSWGLADFPAAEELGRSRGHWWLADSSALLAEYVDESTVAVRWIADPANPEREPVAHRYPAAGTSNPDVRLFVLSLTGARAEVLWDHDAFPYLATVQVAGDAVVSVLSRDQQRQLVLDVRADGSTAVAGERSAAPWLTMVPGVPTRTPDGRLVEVVADLAEDAFRLVVDGRPRTPGSLQVTGVTTVGDGRAVVTAQPGPMDQHVYEVDVRAGQSDAERLRALTDGSGVHGAAGGAGGLVLSCARPDAVGATYRLVTDAVDAPIASLAERPVVDPRPHYARVTDRAVATAVLRPTGHVPGSRRLPVVLAPYGGPHHARVVHAAGAYAADQWLADQGFAVVVIDGAGTPGRGPAFEYEVRDGIARRVLEDQVAGLHAIAASDPDLDLSRVGITGWSFGGYLAALAVLDRPDVFAAAVAGAPVTDWALYDTAYTERYLGLPLERAQDYEDASLLTRADRLERPLLLIHGLADDNVLAAHTLRLSGALLAAGRPHTVLPLSGVTHMTPQEVVAENLLRLQVDFLRTHLAR